VKPEVEPKISRTTKAHKAGKSCIVNDKEKQQRLVEKTFGVQIAKDRE